MAEQQEPASTTLSSPANKSVSFAPSHQVAPSPPPSDQTNEDSGAASPASPAVDSAPSPSSSSSPTQVRPPPIKRRRSSLKQGIQMPTLPPKQHYQHPDPLLRRLRLNDQHGEPVDLQKEFRDAKLVLFMFGATWRGSSQDPYQLVESFAKRQPHRVKVVFVSVDDTKRSFEQTKRGRSWLSMEWNDGSNESSDSGDPEPDEPFLLAGDDDLEEETSVSDTDGTLYLRPFSRVFLAEKLQVLGVPNLAVYHVGKREMLTTHARLDLLRPSRADDTLERWERGEKIQLSLGDIAVQMRWTLTFAAVGVSYLAAVHLGGAPNYIVNLSEKLTRQMLSKP